MTAPSEELISNEITLPKMHLDTPWGCHYVGHSHSRNPHHKVDGYFITQAQAAQVVDALQDAVKLIKSDYPKSQEATRAAKLLRSIRIFLGPQP